jgi:hypothetical protein
LPALSVQLPLTVAFVAFGPEYVVPAHDAIPEKELPLTVALTGWLYQPPASAARDRPTDNVGVDVSTRSGSLVLV